MIKSKLKWLQLAKSEREKRKLTYETMSAETGLSKGTLVRLMNGETDRVDFNTLTALCKYFECGVGDLLEYVAD